MDTPSRSFLRRTSNIVVLSGSAHRQLAEAVASELGVGLGDLATERFADQEVRVRLREDVAGRDVYLIQPTSTPANDRLMELLLTVEALRRADAGRVTVVIPYLGYQRQEKQMNPGEPISAKLVARMIELAGAQRAMLVDVHAPAVQGFFDIPVRMLSAATLLADSVREQRPDADLVVVSPDMGGVKRAEMVASHLGSPVAIVDKRRPRPDVVEVTSVFGDVEGRDCLIVDDVASTGGTLIAAAQALKQRGARTVSVAVTHGVFAPGALERLQSSVIDSVLVTDTVPQPGKAQSFDDSAARVCPKLRVVSVASILAQAIAEANRAQPPQRSLT